jgi:hypothetical protein
VGVLTSQVPWLDRLDDQPRHARRTKVVRETDVLREVTARSTGPPCILQQAPNASNSPEACRQSDLVRKPLRASTRASRATDEPTTSTIPRPNPVARRGHARWCTTPQLLVPTSPYPRQAAIDSRWRPRSAG